MEDEEKLNVRKEQFPKHLSAKIDYRGATALFYAVLNDNSEMVKLLIDAGADPLVKLHQGISPIEIVDENSKDGLLIKVVYKFSRARSSTTLCEQNFEQIAKTIHKRAG